MDTHRATAVRGMWVCCGVRVQEAHRHGLGTDEVYSHNGHSMVGGCRKAFTRKDALTRHLRDSEDGCCGDVEMAVALGILGPRSIAEES